MTPGEKAEVTDRIVHRFAEQMIAAGKDPRPLPRWIYLFVGSIVEELAPTGGATPGQGVGAGQP